ncbi:MAG: hypothetical protein DWH81_15720 [Planctomycetota bacterium]|nr:MAG: hypothetical protein DWH81_15720 [Planctomycetota bacterium]
MSEHIICRCPFCSVKLKLGNPQLEGKKIKCPKCSEPFVVAAISETSFDQDSPTTVSKSKPVASVPSRVEKKPASRPVPADDDWLNDLGDIEDSPGKLPPIVRKKKRKQAPEEIGERKRSKEGRELPLVVHYLMMAGTGLIGGLIGAAIWAGLIYYTGFEIGYVAVFVGFLSGVGVRFGANQWDYGLGPGLAAVAVAILALIAGKIAGVQLILHRELGNLQAQNRPAIHENIFIAALAEEVKAAQPNAEAAGTPNTPAQVDEEVFEPEKLPQQYPPEIWNQAKARWDEVPDAKKKEILDEGAEQFQELAKPNLSLLFGPFDILWFFLAIGAAFRAATVGQED